MEQLQKQKQEMLTEVTSVDHKIMELLNEISRGEPQPELVTEAVAPEVIKEKKIKKQKVEGEVNG